MGTRPVQGTTDILQASDNNGLVTYYSGSAVAVTLPAGLPKSFLVTLIQIGAGVVTVSAGTGVTANSLGGSFSTGGQYGGLDIHAYGPNQYTIASGGSGGGGGTVTSVVAQAGPFLASGTVTTSGTISNSASSLTAHGVILAEGTAAAVATAAGTDGQLLVATTSADPAFVSMSGDATITKAGAITVSKIGGNTLAANTGAVLNSGTVQINNSLTLTGTAGGTLTLSPTTGTSDVLINMPAGGGTVTLGYAGSFARQRMEVDIKQGATAGVIVLNTGTAGGFVGTLVSTFSLTAVPGDTDSLMCIAPGTAYTRVYGIMNGFTA